MAGSTFEEGFVYEVIGTETGRSAFCTVTLKPRYDRTPPELHHMLPEIKGGEDTENYKPDAVDIFFPGESTIAMDRKLKRLKKGDLVSIVFSDISTALVEDKVAQVNSRKVERLKKI